MKTPRLHFLNLAFISTCLILSASNCFAQNSHNLSYGAENEEFPKILDLNWLNEQFLIKQRKRVEEITRTHFGQSLKSGKNNFPLLQRIIDEQIIEADDTVSLQALGVVLGDIFVDSNKNFAWKVYEDDLGKSHAVCVEKTKQCLFPVTMLSKRIENKLKPTVKDVYQKGLDAMQPFLPKLPFSSP
ncbi:hypothetical protein TDB9533_01120 [Thalassocella blandensis]|nr:hypothetical protein TDB9533_01120 [Thalassocella blandensis]